MISPSNGRLAIRLQLYKGTNNNGCFYGLTGITLKGSLQNNTTALERIERDDIQAIKRYDTTGRIVKRASKGIYIVNGVKKVVR